jgi:hypothetical protein
MARRRGGWLQIIGRGTVWRKGGKWLRKTKNLYGEEKTKNLQVGTPANSLCSTSFVAGGQGLEMTPEVVRCFQAQSPTTGTASAFLV